MAEDFQAGVCDGGAWWSSPTSSLGFSPCSTAVNDAIGSFGWQGDDLVQATQRPPQPDSASGRGGLMGSDIPVVGGWLSSSSAETTDWSQPLFGCAEIQKVWSLKSREESTMSEFPQTNLLPASFPMDSSANSSSLQTIFDTADSPSQHSLFQHTSLNYPSKTNNLGEFFPSPTKFPPLLRPSLPNSNPVWIASSSAALNGIPTNLFPPRQLQLLKSNFENKSICSSLVSKLNNGVQDLGSAGKRSSYGEPQPMFKRPRIETPSPLPTFKVRKEKLGDRVTALQQLVSPFGKTDTASVLHEAIEYIKFLHEQVSVLSTPYMKNGAPIQHQEVLNYIQFL
ncbi:unnamed protein product [Thlaspi arvense]|uniref:BHLH domain-containing protein n=1 Tax=Thlaspi arvense TaxID=13288 RepID=A0AAU9RJX9_THLAR|nr:unnamed protein product [Thlaspi arvense]